MTGIMLSVTGAQAWAKVTGPLTAGMVGIPVTIEYDAVWEGLTKNLVCRCSPWDSDDGETRVILNVGKTAVVAHEVMQEGMYLYLGIEGFREDGELVIPTTWARCDRIRSGANADGDPTADPELPVWSQLQMELEQIKRGSLTGEQMSEIQAYAQAAMAAAQRAEAAVDSALQMSGGGLGGAAASLLAEILRSCATYGAQTGNIDLLEGMLTPGAQPVSGVYQIGKVLYIIDGVTVSQDGGTLHIA